MRTGLIYCATSPSGKKYYGRTIQALTKRKYHHNADARGNSKLYFHNAIRKYGEENIKWSVVETIRHEDPQKLVEILNEREIFYIDRDDTLCPNGYNLNKGGGNYAIGLGPAVGKTYEEIYGTVKAEEIKEKQKKGMLGKNTGKQSQKTIEKRSLANTGKKRTEESKEKIRQALLGKRHTAERRANQSRAKLGVKHTAERIANRPRLYGKDSPRYIPISQVQERLIVRLHTEDFLSAKKIAQIVGINWQKVLKLLRDGNRYIDYKELKSRRRSA